MERYRPLTRVAKNGKKLMAKGHTRVGGRQKGTVNKTSRVLKECILLAAEETGSDNKGKEGLLGYLKSIARTDKKTYAGLLRAVLPLQIHSTTQTDVNHTFQSREEIVRQLQARGLPVDRIFGDNGPVLELEAKEVAS